MSMAVQWNTKLKWHTGFSADSVEWCPVEPYRNVLVCGTYQLDKKDDSDRDTSKQTRLGKIYLFVIEHDTTELIPVQTISIPGVLDQKWCYHNIQNYPTLAVVNSEGALQLYQLINENGTLHLKFWLDYTIGQDILTLSVDWSTNKLHSEEPSLVISDSSGSVTVLKVVEDGLAKVREWKAHSFEAWIAAFNYWNTDLFYSGGDDCVFKCYDIRVPEAAVAVNKKHDAGVTSVRSNLDVEHQVLTGSYDEKVRLWDARNLKSCITETDVNGGVWRLKYHPYEHSVVLAACMYGGFRTLRVSDPELTVVSEYLEHESIAYGADWKHDDRRHFVATCSFYDCKMHVSEIIM